MNPESSSNGRLRQRLEEIARRRLPESAVESVLEDTLQRIEAHDADTATSAAPLLGCLRILREEICSHYAEHPPVATWAEWTPDKAPVVVESMDSESLRQVSEDAMGELAEESPATCGYLRQLAVGASPAEVAGRVQGGLGALRQRLQRGRNLFDRFLVARGART